MSNLLSLGLGPGLIGLGLAALLAVLLVPPGIRLAWRLGVVDRPVGDKIHDRTTPLMGGVAVSLAFLVVAILVGAFQGMLYDKQHGINAGLVGLLTGSVLATLLGVADEIWTLPPRRHFLGQAGVVLIALMAGFPRIEQFSNPFFTATPYAVLHHVSGSHYLSYLVGLSDPKAGLGQVGVAYVVTYILGVLFTVFWITGMMNTVNFLDGLDGLAGGVSAISALFLGLWALAMAGSVYGSGSTYHDQNVILPLILCGAILGFLVFNWAPARVFMGDSGAMFIGFTLGALSIFGPVKLGTAFLIFIVPILDVAWAIVRRLLGRKSFASGDKHHIYHRMLELGMSRRSVVLSFYVLCATLGVIDLNLYKKQKLAAIAVVALLATLGAVALEVRGQRAQARAGSTPLAEPTLPVRDR